MREDLQFLEQVDAYLNGSLNSGDKLAFESQLAENKELNEIFETQKDLIHAAKRKALLNEIKTISLTAGGTSWIASNAKWILSTLIVGSVGTALFFLVPSENEPLADAGRHLPLGDSIMEITASQEYNSVAMTEKAMHPGSNKRKDKEPVQQQYGTRAYINSMSFFPNFKRYNDFQSRLNEYETENKDIIEVTDVEVVRVEDYKSNKIYNRTASFPNGNLEMKNFILTNLVYPQEAAIQKIEANVQVDFVVDESGNILEIDAKCFNLSESEGTLTKPYSSVKMFFSKKMVKAFENEALRLMELMPTWEYATNSRGKAITSRTRLYFDFNYPNPSVVYQLDNSESILDKGKGWKY